MNDGKFITGLRNVKELDIDTAIESIGGSAAIYGKLMRQIIRLTPSNLLRMDEAMAKDTGLAEFAIAVHGVKGTLSQAGCTRLATLGDALEDAAKAGNRQFCLARYSAFRTGLAQLYEQIKTALDTAKACEESDIPSEGNISDYRELLTQAADAANDCDSLLAVECMAQLQKLRFGDGVDAMIQSAVDSLEVFQPQQALEYIIELMKKAR